MCGAAVSCSIAINVCQILEIDLEKLLRGGNSILALTLVYFSTLRHAGSGAMLLLVILVWGLLAIIVGLEANVRGRSAIGWSTLAFLISPFVAGGILWLSTWHTSVDDQSLEQNIQVAQLALPGWGSVEFWMKDCG
jgi:hypothetical protein